MTLPESDGNPRIAAFSRIAHEGSGIVQNEEAVWQPLLPSHLIPTNASATDCGRILRRLLLAVLDEAFSQRQRYPTAVEPGWCLAFGALMGLVTENPGPPHHKPSEMDLPVKKTRGRQVLAGYWTTPRVSERTVRANVKKYLATFEQAYLDYIEQLTPQEERAVTEAAKQPDTSTPETSSAIPEADQRPRRNYRAGLVGAAAIVTLIAAAIGGFIWWNQQPDGKPTVKASSTPTPSPSIQTFTAHVAYTYDASQGKPYGVNVYGDPVTVGVQRTGSLAEGTLIAVVCQNPKGRSVLLDPKYPGPNGPALIHVWYRLDDGNWISAVYVKFDPVAGKPPTVPTCRAH